ncbi:hypothetical protein BJ508DRAFT_410953 [Ascobolus immersus RN42]|uniref:Uncharacterized protein n=1 Tax=Ascobolus immersus RN42 TaxID=1160509 RepID=A0A3N4IPV5_ASCIM|nr:hypothetical protein BJ508DRAFT_410953 [Ascobolus immersus RN42]
MIILRGSMKIPPGWDTEDDQSDCFKTPSPYPDFQPPAWWTWPFDKGPNKERIQDLLRYSNHLEEEDHKRKFTTEERQGLTYYKSMLYRHLAIGDTTTGIMAGILAFNMKEKPAKWSPRPWLMQRFGPRQGKALTAGIRMILYSIFLRPPIYAFTAVTSTKAIQEQMKQDPRMQRFIQEDSVIRQKQLAEIAKKVKERTGRDIGPVPGASLGKDDDPHEYAIKEAQEIDRLARKSNEEVHASDEDYYRIVGSVPENSSTITSYTTPARNRAPEPEPEVDEQGSDPLSGILGAAPEEEEEEKKPARGWKARMGMKKGEESAWEKLRREASEDGSEWKGAEERKTWKKSSKSSKSQSDSEYEDDKAAARAKAQAEFDAALERERKMAAGEDKSGKGSW